MLFTSTEAKIKNYFYTHKERERERTFSVSTLNLVSLALASEPPTWGVQLHKLLAAPDILENIHSVKTLPKNMSPMAITRVHASEDICE